MYSPANTVHDNLISSLESTFSKSFHIEDAEKSKESYAGDDYCDSGDGGLIHQETHTDKTCLRSSANTNYYSNKTLPPSSSDEDLVTNHVIQANIAKNLLKPVSAMKGSREKRGSRTKLTVKWAPDVYDSVPRSYSFSVKSKRQHKSRGKKIEKKNGKSQKSTYSRRVRSKDKNQHSRSVGTSDQCCNLLDSRNELIGSSAELDALDYQDSLCETRSFKQSVRLVDYSVA